MITLILEGEQPWSWNRHWAGVHWRKRAKERDRVHLLVRSVVDPDAQPFAGPVHITVRAYFKDKRSWLDSSNICAKPYIDALIGWYIEEDSPVYVPVTTTESYLDKENSRLEIEIKEMQ